LADDNIGLPKPYGVHAPMKPLAPGLGGMRHFRKPTAAPEGKEDARDRDAKDDG
jgi:hypothetical protein